MVAASSQGRAAARAIDALRRGWPVRVAAGDGAIRVMAIEGADAVTLAGFDPHGQADILISAARAETLKLANQLAAADPDLPVMVERTAWIDVDVATSIADPVLDLASPLKGLFRAKPLAAPLAAATGSDEGSTALMTNCLPPCGTMASSGTTKALGLTANTAVTRANMPGRKGPFCSPPELVRVRSKVLAGQPKL